MDKHLQAALKDLEEAGCRSYVPATFMVMEWAIRLAQVKAIAELASAVQEIANAKGLKSKGTD